MAEKKLNRMTQDSDKANSTCKQQGNGYLLHNQREALVIEAGVSLLQVKKALNFCLGIIKGCVVTHRHRDHSRYIKQYADAGIKVLTPDDVFEDRHHRYHTILKEKDTSLVVSGFFHLKCITDVPCNNYIINNYASGWLCLFLIDTCLCECTFPDLNHIIIEAH